VLIKGNISLTLVTKLADRGDIEKVEIVFIRYEKHSIIFLLESSLNFHVWSPKFGVVRPVTTPFFKPIRIPNLYEANFLCAIVIFIG